MTVTKILYTTFFQVKPFIGFCSRCHATIAGECFVMGIDVWKDGVLSKTRIIKGHENLCADCFNPLKGRFQEKKEL